MAAATLGHPREVERSMSTVRVETLNIWNKSGPWTERLGLIRREIAARQPDVIGLQEVLRLVPPGVAEPVIDERTCQATEIAAGFGYHVAYAAASDYGGGLMFGNAILSRFPLRDERAFFLPSLDSG